MFILFEEQADGVDGGLRPSRTAHSKLKGSPRKGTVGKRGGKVAVEVIAEGAADTVGREAGQAITDGDRACASIRLGETNEAGISNELVNRRMSGARVNGLDNGGDGRGGGVSTLERSADGLKGEARRACSPEGGGGEDGLFNIFRRGGEGGDVWGERERVG